MVAVIIPGEATPALRLGRQRIDKASDRGFRHDLVLCAIRHQHWCIEERSGRERRIHQVDEAIDRVDPGLVDHQRIMRQGPQHRDVVRWLDLEPAAGEGEPRHQPDAGPQCKGRQEAHRRASPDRGCGQNDPIDIRKRGAALAGHRDHRHRPSHALAEKIDRHSWVKTAQDLGGGRGVGREGGAARPEPALGCRAKAALIVSIGGDPFLGPDLARSIERVAVVVEAVQSEDHRPRLTPATIPWGEPFAQRQHRPIGSDKARLAEMRHRRRLGRRLCRADSGEPGVLVDRWRAAE